MWMTKQNHVHSGGYMAVHLFVYSSCVHSHATGSLTGWNFTIEIKEQHNYWNSQLNSRGVEKYKLCEEVDDYKSIKNGKRKGNKANIANTSSNNPLVLSAGAAGGQLSTGTGTEIYIGIKSTIFRKNQKHQNPPGWWIFLLTVYKSIFTNHAITYKYAANVKIKFNKHIKRY